MNFLSYGIIKDLYKLLAKHSSKDLKSQYDNFNFLQKIGANPLENSPLSVYYYALYNFICQGYHKEWSFILSEQHVIESYEKEFIDLELPEGSFREMINTALHSAKNVKDLKNNQFIDDNTYDTFINEIDRAKISIIKGLSMTDREIYTRIVRDPSKQDINEKEVIDKTILKYLHKAKKRHELRGDQINKFYIEVLGKKAELEISATEHWDELDFSEEVEISSELKENIEPTSDKVINLAKNISRLFLRGNPGTGKTTSLNKIYYENILAALDKNPEARIPLLIEAKNYSAKGDLVRFILKSLNIESNYFEDFINNYKVLVIIDGLNEIKPSLINDARTEIKEFIEEYSNPHYIITSRKYNFKSYKIEDAESLELKIYDIRPLDEEDIKSYIRKHTTKHINRGKEIWQQIRMNPNIRELVTNPMYLRMILAVAAGKDQKEKRIPQSKGELYHKFMSKLLDWEERQMQSWESSQKMRQKAKVKYISYLAYHMIHERTIPEEKVIDILDSQINDYNNSIIFLEELRHNYLIKQEETGNLSFAHDTYSEYFAAVWISRHFEVNGKLSIDISEQQWFESILMCSDIFTNPKILDQFLTYLLMGGDKQKPILLDGTYTTSPSDENKKILQLKNTVTSATYNRDLSIGCSVAYNIFKKTNKPNRKKYFIKAERILMAHLKFWMNHYLTTGKEAMPVENVFAAVGALSSRIIFNEVFCNTDWISVWGKLDFYSSAGSFVVHSFEEEERKKLDDVSRLSLNALINNLNNFIGFYFYLVNDIPKQVRIYNAFDKDFFYLKNKLLADNVKSNIELMKYLFRRTKDYEVLKKIGERDIDFYLHSIKKLNIEAHEVANYLRRHPLLNIEVKLKFDQLETLEEKISFFQKIRILNDSNISDSLTLAQEYIAIKDYEGAKKHFLKVLNISPKNATSLSFLVRYYKKTKKYKEGIKILTQAEKAGGDAGFIISSLGEFYRKNKQSKEAIHYFNLYLEKYEKISYILMQLALSHLENGDKEMAVVQIEKALDSKINFSPSYYSIIGDIYKKVGQIELAIEYFEKYVEYDNKNIIIWGNLGDCYRITKQTEKALEAFLAEYELNKKNYYCLVGIGDCYRQLHQYEEAIEWLEKAERVDGTDTKLMSILADCHKKTEQYDKAITYLKKCIELEPENPISLGGLADTYKRKGDFEEAIVYFKRQLAVEPMNVLSLGSLADSYKKLGDLDTAIEYMERQIVLEPDNPISLGSLADSYKKQDNHEKAIEYLERQLALEPENILSLGNLANSYKKIGNLEKAAEYLEKCIELEPENPISLGGLADTYKKQGKLEKAIEIFQRQIVLEPENVLSLGNIGDSYKKLGNLEKAIEYFEKEIALNPENVLSIGNLADSYRKHGDLENAIKYLERQNALETDNPIALASLADCYTKQGNYEKAIEFFEKQLKLEPDNVLSLGNIANSYKKLENYEKAIEHLEHCISLESDNPISLGGLADAYKKAKNYKKAIEIFERQIVFEPENLLSLGNLANAYKKVGNLEKSIEYGEKEIALKPDNPLSLGNLADSYKKSGNMEKAIECFEKQIELSPDNPVALGSLADSYTKKGEFRKAIELFEREIILSPKNVLSLGNLANAYKQEGNLEKAIEYLERQVEIEPNNPLSLGSLADTYKKHGNIEKAVEFFENQIRLEPNNVLSLGNLADSYKKLEQPKKVIEYLERQVVLEPENILTLGNLADYYKKHENFKKAAEYFERCIKIDPTNKLNLHHLIHCYIQLGQMKKLNKVKKLLKNL